MSGKQTITAYRHLSSSTFVQSQRLFILGYVEHQPPLLRPQEFVEQTKENSGLDFDKLNKQPGFASETNVGTSPSQAVRSAVPAPCLFF